MLDRPQKGGIVALDDEHLAMIGLAVVYEASAKHVTVATLRALEQLSLEEWKVADRMQFSQVIDRLDGRVSSLADEELSTRFLELKQSVTDGLEARHIVVHAPWGEGGDSFVGYDYRRSLEITPAHIREAMKKCAEIKRACHWFAMRVGELVKLGAIAEREKGPGMSICVEDVWIRL